MGTPRIRKFMSLRKKTKKKCSHCGNKQGKLKRCTGCRLVFYCNEQCQRSNWKCHKKTCKKEQRKSSVNTYSCSINNFGTIYLFKNPSGISLGETIQTIPWTDTTLKGFTEKNIPFLLHPEHGSIKVKFPKETNVKEFILSSHGFDCDFHIGFKHTNSSHLHGFEATSCVEAVQKMVGWLGKFPWLTEKPFDPPYDYNTWGEGAKEFAQQLIQTWGISREEFYKLHFNYVQMLPHRVLTGEIRIIDRHKGGLQSFKLWYEQYQGAPETLYKFSNELKRRGIRLPNFF